MANPCHQLVGGWITGIGHQDVVGLGEIAAVVGLLRFGEIGRQCLHLLEIIGSFQQFEAPFTTPGTLGPVFFAMGRMPAIQRNRLEHLGRDLLALDPDGRQLP